MWGSQGWQSQWAMQPAMFNGIPHEQIDWAELAKQWIQMKQTPSEPPPLPPPMPPQVPAPPASLPPPPPPGHGPPNMGEELFEKRISPPLLKTPMVAGVAPEPFCDRTPFQNEPAPYITKPSEDNFWSKPNWEGHVSDEINHRIWPEPPMEPPVPMLAGKETFDYGHVRDNPPLAMQSIDYNHMSEFPYNSVYPTPDPIPETHYDQYWSQVSVAPSTISPMFLKKERTSSMPVEEDSNQLDAAKRKTLPAWIRDGLEKMEQERLKRLEKEKEAKESAEKAAKTAALRKQMNLKEESSLVPAKSKFESDSEEGEVEPEDATPKRLPPVEKRQASPVEDLRTEEEKKQDLMLKVRRTLTEVLLSVTNSEMIAIAQDMLRKAMAKAPARQLASSASLSSVASGLRGLASYGTESEASDVEEDEAPDSEEELYQKIKEKKKLFAVKERKIIAELEEQELQEKLNAEKINNERKARKELINSEQPGNIIHELNIGNRNFTPIPFLEQESKPFPEEAPITKPEKAKEIEAEEPKPEIKAPEKSKNSKTTKEETVSSDSSSSSSNSETDSSGKPKKKASKEVKKDKTDKDKKRDSQRKDRKSSHKDSRRKRSRSRSSSKRRERSRDRKSKKKKSKRSDSSSSSNSSHRKSHRSSKHESSRNHKDSSRNKSSDDRDRKRKRSCSPGKSHRKSDGHSSRREEDKNSRRHKDEKRHREHRKSPSPHRSSKLPRKYRSSRSLSSESESSGKKSKKSRNH